MDRFLSSTPEGRATRSVVSTQRATSSQPMMQRQKNTAKGDKHSAKSSAKPSTSQTPSSPELSMEDGIVPPQLFPQHEPQASSEAMHATLVAQEVSKLLLPLFDKRLEMLHTSINSALTQITTNSQKIADLETRVQTSEQTVSTLQETVRQSEATTQALQDKVEDLENRDRRNNLRFVGIPETVTGEQLLDFLCQDLPQAHRLGWGPTHD